MCTGRVDLAFVLRAFLRGADGVLIVGCHLNECNYLTHGNFYALSMVSLCKELLAKAGLSPARLTMGLVSGGEASRFVAVVNDFSDTIRGLGPLGSAEGAGAKAWKGELERFYKLVPYIKLTKRDKLALHLQDQDAYSRLYSSGEVESLLREVVSYYVDPAKCQACMMCAKHCPVEAIDGGKKRIHVIDQDTCIKCGKCLAVCPPRFGAVVAISGGPVPPPVPESARTIDRRRKAP